MNPVWIAFGVGLVIGAFFGFLAGGLRGRGSERIAGLNIMKNCENLQPGGAE